MDLNRMMQQAQKAAREMQQVQEELANTVIDGTAGGGMVSVQVTGDRQVRSIKISPEAVDPDDVEMLEDLLLAALQDAMSKAEELSEQKLSPLTSGLNIPGLM
jgi:DNA-binding YbaB/EbfC family protein